jgi:hypothetical protein
MVVASITYKHSYQSQIKNETLPEREVATSGGSEGFVALVFDAADTVAITSSC